MRKLTWLLIGYILLQTGCSMVKPEPVSFDHKDEFIKGEGFMVLADRREFAVMAFLNAVGFDDETKGQKMHPVRLKVRELVKNNLAEYPDKVKQWRKYRRGFFRKPLPTSHYLDFVLCLSTDYPFRQIRPDKELNYSHTGILLKDLPDVLNDFWKTAKLDEVWEQVKPDYIDEIKKYNFTKMQKQMDFLWDYMHMERQDNFTIVHVPNLLDRHYRAIGGKYENYYYSVEGPDSGDYSLNNHEYLHSFINDLVKKNFKKQKSKLMKYYNAGKNGPSVRSYRNPVIFTYECLVIALDMRINIKFQDDPRYVSINEEQLINYMKEGLNLTLPFYNLLEEYEKSGKPFDEFLPTLLERLPEYSQ
jgi:hypothetical protein